MERRNFLELVCAGSGGILLSVPAQASSRRKEFRHFGGQMAADIVITGGGLGGCAAALAACRNGLSVIMTEETGWIGGQASQQGVPPDEHSWIETHGAPASYRDYRNRIRSFYRRNYPLTPEALSREYLNPGNGAVSRLCHEPRVTVCVLTEMLAPWISSGRLKLLLHYRVKEADVDGDRVKAVKVINSQTGNTRVLAAPYFVDATECGDLLPLTKTEYRTGTESKSQTGELHAPEDARPGNNQAFTLCFAMDYQPGVNNVIDRPENYNFWSTYIPQMTPPWPGRLFQLRYSNPRNLSAKELGFHPEGVKTGNSLNLWNYRRIVHRSNFVAGAYEGDITIVNWPQNDYLLGNLIDVDQNEFDRHIEAARQLNRSLLYWLQTEVPRPDGGTGWPGLRLRPDVMGTEDGMAQYPYVRESRRIKAAFTILEEHVGVENRTLVAGEAAGKTAAPFYDSIGIGYYPIDLHPSCRGDNSIDLDALPFQIPLGALLPERMNNLFPAAKNIGTTHITNGCYRLHPVEWSIGEAVGLLIAFARNKKMPPGAIRERGELLAEFQEWIRGQGLETHWPI